jgi:hypothetical protein
MPRFYCDYCNMVVPIASPHGRRQHRYGWKHRENFKLYYEQILKQQREDEVKKFFTDRGLPVPPALPPGISLASIIRTVEGGSSSTTNHSQSEHPTNRIQQQSFQYYQQNHYRRYYPPQQQYQQQQQQPIIPPPSNIISTQQQQQPVVTYPIQQNQQQQPQNQPEVKRIKQG